MHPRVRKAKFSTTSGKMQGYWCGVFFVTNYGEAAEESPALPEKVTALDSSPFFLMMNIERMRRNLAYLCLGLCTTAEGAGKKGRSYL